MWLQHMLWLAGGAHVRQKADGLLPAATQQPVARLRPRPRARGRSTSCPLPSPEIGPASHSGLIAHLLHRPHHLHHQHHLLFNVPRSFPPPSPLVFVPLLYAQMPTCSEEDRWGTGRHQVTNGRHTDDAQEDYVRKKQLQELG